MDNHAIYEANYELVEDGKNKLRIVWDAKLQKILFHVSGPHGHGTAYFTKDMLPSLTMALQKAKTPPAQATIEERLAALEEKIDKFLSFYHTTVPR